MTRLGPAKIIIGELRSSSSPSWIVTGRLITVLVRLVSVPIVVVAIGPAGRGETASAIAAQLIVGVLIGLGLPLEVRRRCAVGDVQPVLRAIRLCAVVAVVPSVLIAAMLAATVFGSLQAADRYSIFFALAGSPLMLLWMCDESALIARKRFGAVAAIQVSQPVTFIIIVLVGLVLRLHGSSYYIYGSLAAMVGAAIVGQMYNRVPVRGKRDSLAGLVAGGIKYAGSMVGEAASNRFDQVLVLPILGASEAGLYSIAVTFASLPAVLGQALGASYFSAIAVTPQGQLEKVKRDAVGAAASIGFVISVVMLIGSIPAIRLLFPRSIWPALPAVWVACIGAAVTLTSFVLSMTLAATGRGLLMTVAQVSGFAFDIVLLLLLGPRLGAFGAALASTAGYTLTLSVLLAGSRMRVRDLSLSVSMLKIGVRRLVRAP